MYNTEPIAPPEHRRVVRYVLPIAGLVLLIAALVGIKFTQISTLINMGKAYQKSGPPPETVTTGVAKEQTWEGTLSAVGSIAAAKGVTVSNDAAGVVSRISFESGAVAKQGQVLLELDSSVERAQLASAQARRDLAQLTLNRSRALVQKNAIPQSQLDADEAQLKTASTDYNALAAQIDRKIVRAPFTGRLGIRDVNLGQYLNPGTPITVLEAIDAVYVDFALPQQLLGVLKVGMPVRVKVEPQQGLPATEQDATIAAIDPQVDSTTRTIKLRASVPNKEEKLRPGMFATATVVLPQQAPVVIVPQTAVLHAPFGDSIFIVEDKKDDAGAVVKGPDGKPAMAVRQQFVRLGESRGDFVAVLDGVKAGQRIVTAGAFKLRNGSGIVENDDVKLNPQVAPHPENR